MKITIRTKEDREKPIRITLLFPTSIIKRKWIWRLAIKSAKPEEQEQLIKIKEVVSIGYTKLKKYIKENGHFTLLEVKNKKTYVKIRV